MILMRFIKMVDDKRNKIEYELQKIIKRPLFYAIFYFIQFLFNSKLTENTKKTYKSIVFTRLVNVLKTDEIKELKDKINNK